MNKALHILLIIALSILITWLLFGNIFLSPNEYLFGRYGDGLKNYYTCAYYIKYDKGLHFSGMNYPYGEHVVYTDNQPIISLFLKTVNENFFNISEYTVGILNALRFLSIIVCCVFIYLILRKFLLPGWYGIIAALILGFLSPQFNRFTAHYALSYVSFIPVLWYCLIRLFEGKKIAIWSLLIIIYLCVFALIHPYYVLIGGAFIISYALVYTLQNLKGIRENYKLVSFALASGIIPIIFFQSFMALTDLVHDRPVSPYGFFSYTASFESVFLPMYSPFIDVWNSFIKVAHANGEGQGYVGFTGLLILIICLFRYFRQVLKGRFKNLFRPTLPSSLPTALWASVIILLFSMGYPFKLGLAFLLDYIPPLKQFRSLGRFVWVFYYVYTAFCAVVIYQIFRLLAGKGLRPLGIFLVFLAFFSWGLYAFINVKVRTDYIYSVNDNFPARNFMESGPIRDKKISDRINVSNFQAILPLPLFLVGSEKFSREGGSSTKAFEVSLHTGLPIAAQMLSRTSLSQTIAITQLLSSKYIKKKILDDLPNEKPFLLMVTNDHLMHHEKELVDKAEFLFEDENIKFYRLPLEKFETAFDEIRQRLKRDSINYKGDGYISFPGKPEYLFVRDFNNEDNSEGIDNSGVFYQKEGPAVMIEEVLPDSIQGDSLEISFWLKAINETSAFPIVHFQILNKEKQEVYHREINPSVLSEVYKEWVRIEDVIPITQDYKFLKVYIDGKEIFVDNVLIRPKGVDIYSHLMSDTPNFLFNNYMVTN